MKLKRWQKIILFILFLAGGLYIYLTSETDVTKNLDDYIYQLPYKQGSSHEVVQGYGGMFSHKFKAALDFGMPIGTEVYAARGGEILTYKDDSDEGGPLPFYQRKANFIMIRHDDGSTGCYWHLKKDGVIVKSGTVAIGQLIGYSGNTGFTIRPHLHFTVKNKLNYKKDSFVRTMFRTSKGIELLKKGESYTSVQN